MDSCCAGMEARFFKSAILSYRKAGPFEERTEHGDARADLVDGSQAGFLVKVSIMHPIPLLVFAAVLFFFFLIAHKMDKDEERKRQQREYRYFSSKSDEVGNKP